MFCKSLRIVEQKLMNYNLYREMDFLKGDMGMKKIFTIMITLFLVTVLVGCGSSNKPATSQSHKNATQSQSDKNATHVVYGEAKEFDVIPMTFFTTEISPYPLIYSAEYDALYTFDYDLDNVDVKVYILDQAWNDHSRYIPQAIDPVSLVNGTIFVAKGQTVFFDAWPSDGMLSLSANEIEAFKDNQIVVSERVISHKLIRE